MQLWYLIAIQIVGCFKWMSTYFELYTNISVVYNTGSVEGVSAASIMGLADIVRRLIQKM